MDREFGCEHYRRAAKFLAPCCENIYICRFCHNEKENHVLNPKNIKTLICLQCNTKQNVAKQCRYCEIIFGDYACLDCKLFDEFKNQYHCKDCGICRVGPKEAFFHCEVCNLCLNNSLKYNHKCIQNVSRDNCPICLEEMHTSRSTLALLECGHFLHKCCLEKLFSGDIRNCPLCQDNLVERQFGDICNAMQGLRVQPRAAAPRTAPSQTKQQYPGKSFQ